MNDSILYGIFHLTGKGYKLLETLVAFMKEFFEKKNQQTTLSVRGDEKILHTNTVGISVMSQLMRYLYL